MATQNIKELSSDVLYYLDTAQSKIRNAKQIQDLFKKSIKVGEAVVSVLENTGIAGFRFNVPLTEQVKMENDITDYYIDTGTAVQDHITQKPVIITLTGLQGEYFYSVHQIQDMLAKVVPTMALVAQFLPKLTPATIQKKYAQAKSMESNPTGNNNSEQLQGNIRRKVFNAIDLFKEFQNIYKLKSAQTRAYLFFEAMRNSRAVFTVETTWKRYDNMAIQSLIPKRDENADITDFTVTFKQITFTESKSESIEDYVNRYQEAMSKPVNKGIDKGKYVDTLNPNNTTTGVSDKW